jgi:hypothetical protein
MSQCQPRPPKSQLENRQAANRTTAIVVPALLIGIVGYVTWIVVVLIGGELSSLFVSGQIWTRGETMGRDGGANHLDRFESASSAT